RAAESLDVGAADAGVADAEQRLTGRRPRGGGLDELDGARCCDVDGSHERPPRTSGTGAVGMATRISSIPYIAALGASSGIWRTIASSLLMNIPGVDPARRDDPLDRKSTRLNSSHVSISYAVFCLKKKNNESNPIKTTVHGVDVQPYVRKT